MPETRHGRLRLALVAAMVAAPFLALLYGGNAALVALCAGLLATAFLAFDASRRSDLDPSVRRRLHAAVAINLGLALLAGLLLLWRVRP
jgi:VIT1/CCC1 family predicted Fe2+/Mn2+ transporter